MEERKKTRSSRAHTTRIKFAFMLLGMCERGFETPQTFKISSFWCWKRLLALVLENFKQDQHQKLESLEMFEGYKDDL